MIDSHIDAKFVRAAAMALLRIRYGADKVEFIDDELSGLVYKIGDDVKYVSLQLFNYEDRRFVCNNDTFTGEDNVMTFHPFGIRMFKVSKVRPLLADNRGKAVKLKNGDVMIPFSVVSSSVKEINFG
jgi:hypothetical protein